MFYQMTNLFVIVIILLILWQMPYMIQLSGGLDFLKVRYEESG